MKKNEDIMVQDTNLSCSIKRLDDCLTGNNFIDDECVICLSFMKTLVFIKTLLIVSLFSFDDGCRHVQ